MFASRRLLQLAHRSSRLCHFDKRNVTPVAMQYVYGNANHVQKEPFEIPEEKTVEGLVDSQSQNEGPVVYPFAIYESLQEAKEDATDPVKVKQRPRRGRPRVQTSGLDQEVVEENKAKTKEEIEELFRYGTSDPSIPASRVPCSGCGAKLHCQDSKMPGFVPFEMFRKVKKNFQKLSKTRCQRCVLMQDYNIALKMNIKPEDYPKALAHLQNQKAIVILIVDLTDFPGSVWPNILDLIGSDKRVILVGNKVDLLPQDSYDYLKTVKSAMVKTFLKKCQDSLDRCPVLLDSVLVSARTGYNIEWLITKIFKFWKNQAEHVGGNVYLIGTTNVGKSSIFNLLLDSDLCDVKALSRIDKATIAPVPGTTLNLLKFPMLRPEPGLLVERHLRLKKDKEVLSKMDRERITNLRKTKSGAFALPTHSVGQTFWYKADQNLNQIKSTAFEMNLAESKAKPEFHPREYKGSKWCHDTPGTISDDQVINLFTQEEILKILPSLPILPRSISVHPGLTVFVGGVARLDVLEGPQDHRWQKHPLILTLFASEELPIHIIPTNEAEEFYDEALKDGSLVVPDSSNPNRLADLPPLAGENLELYGISDEESACDIVLSSIGWFSVTTKVTLTYLVKAWTPGGKGIFLREHPFLPYAVNLKGSKPRRSNYYGPSAVFVP